MSDFDDIDVPNNVFLGGGNPPADHNQVLAILRNFLNIGLASQAQVDALELALLDIELTPGPAGESTSWRGEWDDEAVYEKLDVVQYEGSAYIAVDEDEVLGIPDGSPSWELMSEKGGSGKTAYELAVDAGYEGTESQWLASLVGQAGAAGAGVKPGGVTGEALVKISEDDYDTEWTNLNETFSQIIEHGAVASTPRPTGDRPMLWVGTVEPTNWAEGDIWFRGGEIPNVSAESGSNNDVLAWNGTQYVPQTPDVPLTSLNATYLEQVYGTAPTDSTSFRAGSDHGASFADEDSVVIGHSAQALLHTSGAIPGGLSGDRRSIYGFEAGFANVGHRQSAVGWRAGKNNTGDYGQHFGYQAGEGNTGDFANHFGYSAGWQNTGDQQTAVGYSAGRSNTGNDQSVLGWRAGYENLGTRQTAMGVEAGMSNTQGYNVAVGYRAGFTNIGLRSTQIGTQAGLTNTGDYQTVLGMEAGYQNSGDYQVGVGGEAGYNNTGDYQTAVGYQAGKSNTGINQTVFGYTAGSGNIKARQHAFGYEAGLGNTGDDQNAFGMRAGQNNTGVHQDVFGYTAGQDNTGANQTAFGAFAGRSNSGIRQVAVGESAGRSNTGSQQSALGYEAGYSNTGTRTVFLGSYAGKGNALNHRLIIHAGDGAADLSTPLIDGRFTTSTGYSKGVKVNGKLESTGELITRSPNGSRWAILIDNAGALTVAAATGDVITA